MNPNLWIPVAWRGETVRVSTILARSARAKGLTASGRYSDWLRHVVHPADAPLVADLSAAATYDFVMAAVRAAQTRSTRP